MSSEKRVQDLMIPLEDYPHLPYWFTLKQAIAIIREADLKQAGVLETGEALAGDLRQASAFEPRALLVFDEKSKKPLGLLTLQDIFRSLAPRFFQETGLPEAGPGLAGGDLFGPAWKEASMKPLSEVMSPIKVTIQADEPMARALFLMIKDNLCRLPVLQDHQVVGMVQLSDLFREISGLLLASDLNAASPSLSEN